MEKGQVRIKIITAVILTAVITFSLSTVFFMYSRSFSLFSFNSNAKMEKVADILSARYVDPVDKDSLEKTALDAMTKSIGDPYTEYLDEDQYSQLNQYNSGIFYGIGVDVIKTADRPTTIVSPHKGGPAERAGARSDDQIVKVDGTDVVNMDLSEVVLRLKGDVDTPVEVTIYRESTNETLVFNIVREKIDIQTVKYEMLEDKIALISIASFDYNTAKDFEKALIALKSENMEKLIIDLRSNPGGLVTSVVSITDWLVPPGLIVYTEDRSGKRDEYKGAKEPLGIPMAVLVNKGSASASEIMAGAIQDYGVGKLVGVNTYGKGIVQQTVSLGDGTALKFTSSKYYTPNGRNIHKIGLKPDIEIENNSDKPLSLLKRDEDAQLQKAIEAVKQGN